MSKCSRRDVLRALSVAVLPLPLLEACGTGPSGPQLGTVTACGSKMCMDITDPTNAALQTTNGSVLANATNGDTIIVIRTSPTTVVALSAICTHAGCLVGFDAGQAVLACPCHGSVYSESGQVEQGPAPLPLTRYPATLSGNQIVIG